MRATLAAHHGDGNWGRGFDEKYRGTSWVLLHLSEAGASMDVEPVRRGVGRLVETVRPVRAFRGERGLPFRDLVDGAYWPYPIACLTAHMALVENTIRARIVEVTQREMTLPEDAARPSH